MTRQSASRRIGAGGPRPVATATTVGILALLSLAHAARSADVDPKREADEKFAAGLNALAHGDWPAACTLFEASMTLDPSVSSLVKIARCRDHEHKLLAARDTYQNARALNRRLTGSPTRQKELEDAIDRDLVKLTPRIPMIRMSLFGSLNRVPEILLDGVRPEIDISEFDRPLPVDPGEHTVIVRAPGFQEERRSVNASESEVVELTFALKAEVPPRRAPDAAAIIRSSSQVAQRQSVQVDTPEQVERRAQVAETTSTKRGSRKRVVGWILGGIGAAGLGVAGYLGIRTLMLVHDADCNDKDVCSMAGAATIGQARRTQTAGFVVAGIGAAALATGMVLVFVGPRDVDRRSTAVTLGLGTQGAWVSGTW